MIAHTVSVCNIFFYARAAGGECLFLYKTGYQIGIYAYVLRDPVVSVEVYRICIGYGKGRELIAGGIVKLDHRTETVLIFT